MKYKSEATVDNRYNNDAFDTMVELYYQTQGYITSVGKSFTVYEPNHESGLHCTLSMIAINEQETVIVSPYDSLPGHVTWDKKGNIKMKTLEFFEHYFRHCEGYLRNVQSYQWLAQRPMRRVVALLWPEEQPVNDNFIEHMNKRGVDVLTGRAIAEKLITYATSGDTSAFPDVQALRLIAIMSRLGFVNIDAKPVSQRLK